MRIIQSAVFQLTLWYLGIIMVLSLLFSWALYRVSDDQINAGTNRQRAALLRLPLPVALEPRRAEYLQALDDQRDLFARSLLLRLGALNLATLLVGGGLSYALARRTLRPIQESLEAQGRFTADASHELRTPLTAMRSEIEVALRDKHLTAAEARTLLSSNLEEIAKLEALSAGLLRLARTDAGLDPAALERVPVQALFEATIDRFQGPIAERRLQLDVQADPGPATVTGDRASLIELVAILLDNAIKYSPAGSTITLASQPAGQFVAISVADHGAGIHASDIPHIFDRFYRADRSRTKAAPSLTANRAPHASASQSAARQPPNPQQPVGGYGLGLSIAKRIADLHNAAITVTSAPGQGSTFTIKIPARYEAKKPPFGL